MKECRRCKELKVNSEFNKAKRSKDGLQSWCRRCTNDYNKENGYNESKTKNRTVRVKVCAKCGKTKSFEKFQTCNSSFDGKHSLCARCSSSKSKRKFTPPTLNQVFIYLENVLGDKYKKLDRALVEDCYNEYKLSGWRKSDGKKVQIWKKAFYKRIPTFIDEVKPNIKSERVEVNKENYHNLEDRRDYLERRVFDLEHRLVAMREVKNPKLNILWGLIKIW